MGGTGASHAAYACPGCGAASLLWADQVVERGPDDERVGRELEFAGTERRLALTLCVCRTCGRVEWFGRPDAWPRGLSARTGEPACHRCTGDMLFGEATELDRVGQRCALMLMDHEEQLTGPLAFAWCTVCSMIRWRARPEGVGATVLASARNASTRCACPDWVGHGLSLAVAEQASDSAAAALIDPGRWYASYSERFEVNVWSCCGEVVWRVPGFEHLRPGEHLHEGKPDDEPSRLASQPPIGSSGGPYR